MQHFCIGSLKNSLINLQGKRKKQAYNSADIFSYKEIHCDLKEGNTNSLTGNSGYQNLTASLYYSSLTFMFWLFLLFFFNFTYVVTEYSWFYSLSIYSNYINVYIQTHTQRHTRLHTTATNFYWSSFPKVRVTPENKALITQMLRVL